MPDTIPIAYYDLTGPHPKPVIAIDLIPVLIDLTEEEPEPPSVPNPVPVFQPDPEINLCPVCFEQEADTELPSCKHKFCYLCVLDWIFKSGNRNNLGPSVSCPTCRNAQVYAFSRNGDLHLICEAIELEEDSQLLVINQSISFGLPAEEQASESDPDGLFDTDSDSDWDA